MVAIILVNYNGIKDTEECIKSILKSTYQDFVIIVVENGSNDLCSIKNNEFIINNSDLIVLEQNTGFSGGNNYGIKYAIEKYNPEFFLLLNNDTIIDPYAIANMISIYKKNENVGIVTSKILYYSHKNILWNGRGKFDSFFGIADQPDMGKEDKIEYHKVEDVGFASGCVMLISNEVLHKVGMLSEEYFMYAEDTDYCCRVKKSGLRILYSGMACVYHKVSASVGNSSKFQIYYMFRNNCKIIKKYASCPLGGYLKLWYRCFKQHYKSDQIKTVVRAWRDFKKGIEGKVELK